ESLHQLTVLMFKPRRETATFTRLLQVRGNYLAGSSVPSVLSKTIRILRAKIGQYTMKFGVLFKKGYLVPMLRCMGPNYVIREIHMGSCGMHVGPRAIVRKAIRQGYYWPTMHEDAKREVENVTHAKNMNQKADVLSKLASVEFNHLTKEVLVEILNERSTENQEVQAIVEEEGNNWMTPIIQCLEEGMWPKDKNEARCLRAKIGQYTMKFGVLFKKGYLVPMLRCMGPLQANYVIREIHMGSCGMHVGPRAIVRKAIRQGYYWPTMHEDAKREVENVTHAKYMLQF
nr:reverse transcriptase domain-containing protein [Tanacetum cinerariifolium]